MNTRTFAFAGLAVCGLGSMAAADLVGVTVTNLGDLGAGVDTYNVSVEFDAPDDALLAVGGQSGGMPLAFSSANPLVNDSLLSGLALEDAPQDVPTSAVYDSWLSISGAGTGDTQFSPGFAGGDGSSAMVAGTSFSDASGGYFDSNPGTVSGGVGSIVIAQFTVGGGFTFSGNVNWRNDTLPSGQFFSDSFSVTAVPAPAAFAFLGLAGLAARRRR